MVAGQRAEAQTVGNWDSAREQSRERLIGELPAIARKVEFKVLCCFYHLRDFKFTSKGWGENGERGHRGHSLHSALKEISRNWE